MSLLTQRGGGHPHVLQQREELPDQLFRGRRAHRRGGRPVRRPCQGSGQLRGGMSSREQDPVVVRIDVRDSDDNYYVGFNHRAKHNSDVPREFLSGPVF